MDLVKRPVPAIARSAPRSEKGSIESRRLSAAAYRPRLGDPGMDTLCRASFRVSMFCCSTAKVRSCMALGGAGPLTSQSVRKSRCGVSMDTDEASAARAGDKRPMTSTPRACGARRLMTRSGRQTHLKSSHTQSRYAHTSHPALAPHGTQRGLRVVHAAITRAPACRQCAAGASANPRSHPRSHPRSETPRSTTQSPIAWHAHTQVLGVRATPKRGRHGEGTRGGQEGVGDRGALQPRHARTDRDEARFQDPRWASALVCVLHSRCQGTRS